MNVINVCALETMGPKQTEFVYIVQKNKKVVGGSTVVLLNNTSVPEMFDLNVNETCTVNSWYIADEGQTGVIDLTHDTAIRMMQVGRTQPVDSLRVNNSQGIPDHTIKFMLGKYLRSATAPHRWLSPTFASVRVELCCIEETLESYWDPKDSTPENPNLRSLNSSTMVLVYPRTTGEAVH